MPAGQDGNPAPIVTPARSALLATIAARIAGVRGERRALVGVDGASGTGKSTMADELAALVVAAGRPVLRATMDSFHRPRADRLTRGADSAVGYYRDSHQLGVLVKQVLVPFAAGADRVDRAAFDEPSDSPATDVVEGLGPDCVLVFNGLFLHRSELAGYWHLSLHLRAERRREETWDAHWDGKGPAFAARRHHRYFDGQALYEAECDPDGRATWVIDNDDLAAPVLIRGG